MLKGLITISFLIVVSIAMALPTITSFSPTSGPVGTIVTIIGTGFSTTLTNNTVYFGAAKATVTAATTTQLTVNAPAGATYQPISVLVGGLIAFSLKPFITTFAGASLDINSFGPEVDFTAGASPRSVAIGDIDGDGKIDAVIANGNSTEVSIYRNTGATGDISTSSFATKMDLLTASEFYSHVALGDLDGDGKLDLAVSVWSIGVSVYRNTSSSGSISFASKVSFSVTNPVGIAIGDIDLDGKAEILLAKVNASAVSVLRNTSSVGTISFAAGVDFTTGLEPWAPIVSDIDGDSKPDIIIDNSNGTSISILRNTSSSGSISFASKSDFSTNGNGQNVAAGDLDGDGKTDIVTSNYGTGSGNTLSIFRNTSSAGSISMAGKVDFTTLTGTVFPSISDLNGDGKPEVISSNFSNGFSVFQNTSVSGSISASSFGTRVDFPGHAYGTAIGDVNSDNRPDVICATWSSSLAVFGNKILAVEPTIQTSNLTVTGVTDNSISFSVTPGNGTYQMIVVKQGAVVNALPADGVVYSGTYVYGTGSQIGAGNYVIGVGNSDWSWGVGGLQSGTGYSIQSFALNDLFPGSNSSSGSANFLTTAASLNPIYVFTLPSAPTASSASSVGPTSFTANWSASTGASSYSIDVSTSNIFATFVASYNNFSAGNVTSYAVTGLSSNTTYYYRIRANNTSGASTSSNTISQSTLSNEPSAPASNLNFSALTTSSFTVAYTAATGTVSGYLAVRKSGSAPITATPVDGASYTLGSTLGDGTIAYVGPTLTFNQSGLSAGTKYYYQIYPYNGSGGSINYLTTSPLAGSRTTLIAEPTIQSTDIFLPNGTSNSITVNFTDGNGSGHLIVVKAGTSVDSEPVDGVTYTPNTIFGSGSNLGNLNYVVGNTSGPVTVTGLVNGTTYTFKVFEYNGSGGSENYLPLSGSTTGNPTSLSDFTVPQITGNTTPTFVAANSPVTVSVTVVDNESAVQNVTIAYGPANSATQTAQDQNMTNTSGNVWQYTIPATSVTELGAIYEIQATSTGGNTPLVPYSVGITQTGSGLTIPYTSFGNDVSKYRIVAVPLVLSSKSVNDVFGDDLGAYGDKTKWRMYRYENGTTSELTGSTTIDAGKGYWLIAKASATISTGTGTTVQASIDTPFEVNLKADWNEIGNPYNFNLSWADVQAANPGLPGLRIYNGDFADGTVLKKLEGGFVKVTTAQTLKFPILKNASVNGRTSDAPSLTQNSLNNSDWQVYFTLHQGDLTNTISGFGMSEKASEGFDAFDGFNMPRFFDKSLQLNHAKKDSNDYYSRDIVPTAENYVWDFFVESTSDERQIDLSWDNFYFGENEKELYLLDVSQKRNLNMRSFNSYSFGKNSSRSFKVAYGSVDFVKEKMAVHEMILHNIWPNPSSGDVTLSFSLPESPLLQTVSFSMTDILGRNLWTQELNYGSGYHEVILKRTNETEGIYMIRLMSGSMTKIARLVLK